MIGKKREKDAERVSVRDANQGFSRLISKVERGARFVVTKNNREVARIEPVEHKDQAADERRASAAERLELLMKGERRSTDGWTFGGKREDLHDRSV